MQAFDEKFTEESRGTAVRQGDVMKRQQNILQAEAGIPDQTLHSRLKHKWVKSLSRVWLFETLWTVAPRLLGPWGFPGMNTGVGCYFLLQGNLPDPGIEPGSPALQADALPSEPPSKPWNITDCQMYLSLFRYLQNEGDNTKIKHWCKNDSECTFGVLN